MIEQDRMFWDMVVERDDYRSRCAAAVDRIEQGAGTQTDHSGTITDLVLPIEVWRAIRSMLQRDPVQAHAGLHVHSFVWRQPGDRLLPPVRQAQLLPCVCGLKLSDLTIEIETYGEPQRGETKIVTGTPDVVIEDLSREQARAIKRVIDEHPDG